MIGSNLIVDSLSESRAEVPLKVHILASIFRDMDADLQSSGYCYYCEICEELLVLSKILLEPERIRWIFRGRCPGCHWSLGSSLRCTRIKVPSQTIFQVHPTFRGLVSIDSPVKSRENSITSYLFEEDASFERGSQPFCNDLIDEALENLLGRFVVLHGDRAAHDLSEQICVKAQMSGSNGGLNSKVIFIDGGNLFDPYLISRYADRYQIRRETVLDGTQIDRAFTCYQLTSLITKTLPDAFEHYRAKLAVIADITRLYTDPDIEERESFNVFNQVSAFLAKLAEKKASIVLATCVTASKNGWLESILFSRAHTVFQIRQGSKPTLEKHNSG